MNKKLTNGGMEKVYKLYAFLGYLLPMTALFLANLKAYSSEGSLFGFWGIVVMILIVIMFKNFIVEFFKYYSILTISVVIIILGLFSDFMATELTLIGVVSLVSGGISLLFSCVADTYHDHAFIIVDGNKQVNTAEAIPQKQAWKEAYGYFFAD